MSRGPPPAPPLSAAVRGHVSELTALGDISKQKALHPQIPPSAVSTAVSRGSGSQVEVFLRALQACPAGAGPAALGGRGATLESATGLATGPRSLTGITGTRGTRCCLVVKRGRGSRRCPQTSAVGRRPRWANSPSSQFLSSNPVLFTCLCYF